MVLRWRWAVVGVAWVSAGILLAAAHGADPAEPPAPGRRAPASGPSAGDDDAELRRIIAAPRPPPRGPAAERRAPSAWPDGTAPEPVPLPELRALPPAVTWPALPPAELGGIAQQLCEQGYDGHASLAALADIAGQRCALDATARPADWEPWLDVAVYAGALVPPPAQARMGASLAQACRVTAAAGAKQTEDHLLRLGAALTALGEKEAAGDHYLRWVAQVDDPTRVSAKALGRLAEQLDEDRPIHEPARAWLIQYVDGVYIRTPAAGGEVPPDVWRKLAGALGYYMTPEQRAGWVSVLRSTYLPTPSVLGDLPVNTARDLVAAFADLGDAALATDIILGSDRWQAWPVADQVWLAARLADASERTRQARAALADYVEATYLANDAGAAKVPVSDWPTLVAAVREALSPEARTRWLAALRARLAAPATASPAAFHALAAARRALGEPGGAAVEELLRSADAWQRWPAADVARVAALVPDDDTPQARQLRDTVGRALARPELADPAVLGAIPPDLLPTAVAGATPHLGAAARANVAAALAQLASGPASQPAALAPHRFRSVLRAIFELQTDATDALGVKLATAWEADRYPAVTSPAEGRRLVAAYLAQHTGEAAPAAPEGSDGQHAIMWWFKLLRQVDRAYPAPTGSQPPRRTTAQRVRRTRAYYRTIAQALAASDRDYASSEPMGRSSAIYAALLAAFAAQDEAADPALAVRICEAYVEPALQDLGSRAAGPGGRARLDGLLASAYRRAFATQRLMAFQHRALAWTTQPQDADLLHWHLARDFFDCGRYAEAAAALDGMGAEPRLLPGRNQMLEVIAARLRPRICTTQPKIQYRELPTPTPRSAWPPGAPPPPPPPPRPPR